jgi:SPOR domain
MMVIGLAVLLAALLAYEVPKYVHGGHNAAPPAATTTTSSTAATSARSAADRQLAVLRHSPEVDPFSTPQPFPSDPTPRNVPTPAGSIDPFAAVAGPATTTTPSQPVTHPTSSPLPEQIVIGKPGGGRVATHGWIVILASIPTVRGESSARTFAKKARAAGLGAVSVLNSSNRKPLRGGYWVVYTGPYSTLTTVSARASKVHTLGYPTAYIRELIVYH